MHIEMMPLPALLKMRHPKNPKSHSIDELMISFRRFDFVAPPTIDEATRIVTAGHGRLEALDKLRASGSLPPGNVEDREGVWWVPVIRGVSFKNDKERDAYLVADNAHTMNSPWDQNLLYEMLNSLDDLEGLGFDENQLAEFFDDGDEVNVTEHVRIVGGSKALPPVPMTNDDWTLHLGECLPGLKLLPDNSVEAVITDPPSGISFMGAAWDSDKGGRDKWIAWLQEIMSECLRVLKPGGHLFAWALPRTSHWTATAIENAGFEIRDRAAWLYLSGFPKSMDASKAIDAHLGKTDERPVLEHREDGRGDSHAGVAGAYGFKPEFNVTSSATEQAAKWEGWGTAMKPALEDWWLARKPLDGTIAENLLAHGVGCLNIQATRIGTSGGSKAIDGARPPQDSNFEGRVYGENFGGAPSDPNVVIGRWPSHLMIGDGVEINDIETPALYFYCPKPAKSETEAGLEAMPEKTGAEVAGREEGSAGMNSPRAGVAKGTRRNTHPTKKPIGLMRWLVRLVTPPGGLVLDPFTGSGTTGIAAMAEGCRFLGWEMTPEYHKIASERLRAVVEDPSTAELVEFEDLGDVPHPSEQ